MTNPDDILSALKDGVFPRAFDKKSPVSATSIGERVGDLAAAAALLGSGSVLAAVGTMGAVTLPMMAADLMSSGPITMAGQTLVTSPATAVMAGIQLLALPVAVAMGNHGVSALTAGKGWKKLLGTQLGRKALEASAALGGLRAAVMVGASSLAGIAATTGAYAATNSTGAAMLAMAAAGATVAAGSSALSGLRQARAEGVEDSKMSAQRKTRKKDLPSISVSRPIIKSP